MYEREKTAMPISAEGQTGNAETPQGREKAGHATVLF